MQFIDIDSIIRGENFQFERELKHLTRAQVAKLLCCSVQQVQQIEEGGKSAYYTESQKLKTARRFANYLGMSEERAFLGLHLEERSIPKEEIIENNKKVVKSEITLFSKIGFVVLMIVFSGSLVYEVALPQGNFFELITGKSNSIKESHSNTQNSDNLIVANQAFNPCDIDIRVSSTFKADRQNVDSDFVIFESAEHQTVCLMDGYGESQLVELIPGLKKTVSIKGPFQVIGNNLNGIEMYYQGLRVGNLTPNLNRIEFLEVPFQNRTTSMKASILSQPIDNLRSSVQENNASLPLTKTYTNNDRVLDLNSGFETSSLLSVPLSSNE